MEITLMKCKTCGRWVYKSNTCPACKVKQPGETK